MSLSKQIRDDGIIRDAMIGFARQTVTETELRDTLRKRGWTASSVARFVAAVKNKTIPIPEVIE